MPYLQPLTDQQVLEVRNLQQSSQQAEDALSQGIEKLQQSLVENIVVDAFSMDYPPQMAAALENLQALEGFVNQVSWKKKKKKNLLGHYISKNILLILECEKGGSFKAANVAANGEDLDDKTIG